MAAPLRQVLAVWNLTTLKTTGQQRVAVLVADIREVLARHTDAKGPGGLQTINEVPFLFRHLPLRLNSSFVLLLVEGVRPGGESEDSVAREVLPAPVECFLVWADLEVTCVWSSYSKRFEVVSVRWDDLQRRGF